MKAQLLSSQRMVTFTSTTTTILLLIVIVLISSSVLHAESKTTTTSKSGHPRGDKMLRLCLWTHCRRASTATSGKCPSYLEQSAVRKCKLENGDIGYYSKCCLYEDAVPYQMQKTSGATTAWPETTAPTSNFSEMPKNNEYLFANLTYNKSCDLHPVVVRTSNITSTITSSHHPHLNTSLQPNQHKKYKLADTDVAVHKEEGAPHQKRRQRVLVEWLTISSYLEPGTSDGHFYHSLIFCGAVAATISIILFIYFALSLHSFTFSHLLSWHLLNKIYDSFCLILLCTF